tara:strand:+ start:218 stop:574 length:357 start_codon:yes stop_codon:yes gene_type:complete
MKYIKITLLIVNLTSILLSSPVIGHHHKNKTLYVLGEYPDWKWIEFGDKKTQSNYQGQVKDGKPNGFGVLISTNGWKYYGSWMNGEIWSGTEYDNYGNIIYRWIEGKKRYHNLNIKFR